METQILEQILSKLTLIHSDLQELITIAKTQNIDADVSNIVQLLKRDFKISCKSAEEQTIMDSYCDTEDISTIRKPVDSLWKRKLN